MPVERVAVLIVLTALAVAVAVALQRRRPDPPSAPSYRAPQQLDRDDFAGRDRPWLLVLFGSVTCDTCPKAWAVVERIVAELAPTALTALTIERVDVENDPDRHARYRVDGVPTTLLADDQGVVRRAWFGPIDAAELTAALDSLPKRDCEG